MGRPILEDGRAFVQKLRAKAARHRRMALTLSSTEDKRITLAEAARADGEADRMAAELNGSLRLGAIATPFYENI
jgi:hypothetical protein